MTSPSIQTSLQFISILLFHIVTIVPSHIRKKDHLSYLLCYDRRPTWTCSSPLLRFTASAIVKALQIYRRGTERITDLPWETLKKEVTVAVEEVS
jgi:hypothetical protein